MRANMKHIRGIKTDRDMYTKVEEIINEIRDNSKNLTNPTS